MNGLSCDNISIDGKKGNTPLIEKSKRKSTKLKKRSEQKNKSNYKDEIPSKRKKKSLSKSLKEKTDEGLELAEGNKFN
jgi:hypothetical protein